MHWLILAVLAALSWALVNNLDKIVVTHFVKSPLAIVVMEGIIGFIVALMFIPDLSLSVLSFQIIVVSVLSGVLLYIFNYLYYRALEKSDPTVIAILLQTTPLFTFVWGALYFTESFTISVYVGASLILLGGVLATIEKANMINGAKRINLALLVMIPANFILSLNYAIQKYALHFTDSENVFFLARLGGLLFAIFFLFSSSVRTNIRQYLTVKKWKEWLFFVAIELFNLLGIFLVTRAYAAGPISLVTTVTSIQPAFVAILGLLIGRLLINQSPERISNRLNGYIIFSIMVIVIGVYLISQ